MINKERLLNHFLEYVQTDSETKHEAAMGRRVAEDLKAMGPPRGTVSPIVHKVYSHDSKVLDA